MRLPAFAIRLRRQLSGGSQNRSGERHLYRVDCCQGRGKNARDRDLVEWLETHVRDVSLSSQGKTFPGHAVVSGEDFIGLQFASPIQRERRRSGCPDTGTVRTGASEGAFWSEDAGNKYIFTQFESIDARDVFPCFDEPAYKVPWQLTLHVPAQEKAVSNTPVVSESIEGATKTYVFKETKPLPSYLIAFGVGPFEFVDAGKAGRNHFPVRIVTPKGKANEAKYAAEVTATILTRLEDYFGIPFPYEKSDQVAIPVTFGFGAMENAGMVTYAQNLILAKPGWIRSSGSAAMRRWRRTNWRINGSAIW